MQGAAASILEPDVQSLHEEELIDQNGNFIIF